jgi:ubiquinone/menaquinone biosynthesis C-methylase UbiE
VVRAGDGRHRPAVSEIARAYDRAAEAWARGPSRIYDVLADVLVSRSPVGLDGRTLLDVGAGRGAAGRAIERVGGRSFALDLSADMVRLTRAGGGSPGAAADALALPVATGSVDGVVASFSYNHVGDPAGALVEAARVTRPGGVVLASAYASDDDHPVKAAVEEAATAAGWSEPGWIGELRRAAVPLLATAERAAAVLAEVGLHGRADHIEVPFPELAPEHLVEWRLGMAQLAPFVAQLSPEARATVVADTLARLGDDPPPLVRRMIVIAAVT